MRTISVSCRKGGCGKSTAVYNLATAMAAHGHRVLMVDADPQASLTIMTQTTPGDRALNGMGTMAVLKHVGATMDSCFAVDVPRVNAATDDRLYLMPSFYDLSTVEMNLATGDRLQKEGILKRRLAEVANQFDFCLIDCPTQIEMLVINAWMASDEVILATKTDFVSYLAWTSSLQAVRRFRKSKNAQLRFIGSIAGLYEPRINEQKEVLSSLEAENLLGTVHRSADVTRATLSGEPVVISRPNSQPAKSFFSMAERIADGRY